jgi:hypothetical protein
LYSQRRSRQALPDVRRSACPTAFVNLHSQAGGIKSFVLQRSMFYFSAHKRFTPSSGVNWINFCKWRGLNHVDEIVTTDGMICSPLIDQLIDADWANNFDEDFKTHFFRTAEYLKTRVMFDPDTHNLLAIQINPDEQSVLPPDFEFCGFDIIDGYGAVSVLLNCGRFPDIYSESELNHLGLIDDLDRVRTITEQLRQSAPGDDHCGFCNPWLLARLKAT